VHLSEPDEEENNEIENHLVGHAKATEGRDSTASGAVLQKNSNYNYIGKKRPFTTQSSKPAYQESY
jgi:hypothetical protein